MRSPAKIKFRAYKCDSRTNAIVVARDLVGKWRLSKSNIYRLIDHLGLSEERQVLDSVSDYVFQDDGTLVRVTGKGKWVGVWYLEDGVVTLDYWPANKLVERWTVRSINNDEILVRTPNEDLDVAGYGNAFGNDVTMRAGASSSQGCIVVKNVGKTAKCVPHRKLFFYAAG